MSNPHEYLTPELARRYRPVNAPLKKLLATKPGVVAAWLDPEAMNDGTAPARPPQPRPLLVAALVEPGCEGSESIGVQGIEANVSFLTKAVLDELLETDEELARVIATGYRLCGCPQEHHAEGNPVADLEALARQIMTGA